MKKLRKKLSTEMDSLQAYGNVGCTCSVYCSCYSACNYTEQDLSRTQDVSIYNWDGRSRSTTVYNANH